MERQRKEEEKREEEELLSSSNQRFEEQEKQRARDDAWKQLNDMDAMKEEDMQAIMDKTFDKIGKKDPKLLEGIKDTLFKMHDE